MVANPVLTRTLVPPVTDRHTSTEAKLKTWATLEKGFADLFSSDEQSSVNRSQDSEHPR